MGNAGYGRNFRVLMAGLIVAFFAVQPGPTAAEEPNRQAPTPQAIAAIRNVILGQQDAFMRDDADTAFSYAAPRLHEIFRTPSSFMAMVRREYQPVYRPRVFSFRPFAWIHGRAVQPVLVVGESGVPMTALYLMERQRDGGWLIAGVVLVPEPAEGT